MASIPRGTRVPGYPFSSDSNLVVGQNAVQFSSVQISFYLYPGNAEMHFSSVQFSSVHGPQIGSSVQFSSDSSAVQFSSVQFRNAVQFSSVQIQVLWSARMQFSSVQFRFKFCGRVLRYCGLCTEHTAKIEYPGTSPRRSSLACVRVDARSTIQRAFRPQLHASSTRGGSAHVRNSYQGTLYTCNRCLERAFLLPPSEAGRNGR
eukprot:719540-Rhodomonas_salina.1